MKVHRIACAMLGLSLLLPGVAAQAEGSWTDQISLFGDFRGRYEGFWYDDDATGFERDDQHRLRYRLRVGAEVDINEYIDLDMRIASGPENVNRSRNQTLGSGNDFDPDDIVIDLAYVTINPLAGREIGPKLTKTDVIFGKFPNLWRSKQGKDFLLWDGDLTPEGVAIAIAASPLDILDLTLHTGYLIVDENGGQSSVGTARPMSDPHVLPVQLRIESSPTDQISGGLNLSYYGWRSLGDPLTGDFIGRAALGGSIPLGLTDDSGMDIGDLRGWAELQVIDDWPILVYGNVVKNFSAEDAAGVPNAGKEDLGWSVGAAVGDKKKWVQLGGGYLQIEANAVPSTFTDSDLFDGRTNREGWVIHGARQIFKNTDLSFTLFISEELEDDLGSQDDGGSPILNPSIANADRIRLQTNLVVKF